MVNENMQEKMHTESERIERLERELDDMKKQMAEFKEESSRTNQKFEERLNELKGKKGADDLKTQVEDAIRTIEKMDGAWSVIGKLWRYFVLLVDLLWISVGLALLLVQTEIEQWIGREILMEKTCLYLYIPISLFLILITAWGMIKPSSKKDYVKIAEIADINNKQSLSKDRIQPFIERLEFEIAEDKTKYGWYFMVALGATILPIGEFNSILILMKPILLLQLLLCFHALWIRPSWLKKQAKMILKSRLCALAQENVNMSITDMGF